MKKEQFEKCLPMLLQGDCLELMKDIPDKSIDMVFCDLPYGTTACKWDSIIPLEPLWKHYKRLIKDNGVIVLFGSQPFTSKLIMSNFGMFKYCWIWEKTNSTGFNHCKNMPMKNYEDIAVFSSGIIQHKHLTTKRMAYNPQGLVCVNRPNRRSTKGFEGTMERKSQSNEFATEFANYPRMIIKFAGASKPVHPTQKPIALCEYLIKTYTNEGETVLDNCMGSGTTGIACLNTNREFVGIEKSAKYFEIAQRRINNDNPKL